MKMKLLNSMRVLLVAAGLCAGASNVWADTEWSAVWSADFASEPSGLTYSISQGTNDITNGYLKFYDSTMKGCTTTTSFNGDAFNVSTAWKMEFDWNCGSGNTNASNVTFATNKGNVFKLAWDKYASAVVVTSADGTELSTSIPLLGYNKSSCDSWSHITIIGDTEKGIYLTITNGATTYVNNQLVTSTFGYPSTFNGSLGRGVSSMFIDNIVFYTPKVAGYVAIPTLTLTGAKGIQRKFTLSCLTENTTIYYATSDIEVGVEGWEEYTGEVTTAATSIWTYAKDEDNNVSDKKAYSTGAGTEIVLVTPTISFVRLAANGSYYYPVVRVTSDNSGIIGAPTATLVASLNGNAIEVVDGLCTLTEAGTLTVTATNADYASSEESVYTGKQYAKIVSLDLDDSSLTKALGYTTPTGSETYYGKTMNYYTLQSNITDFLGGSYAGYNLYEGYGIYSGSEGNLGNVDLKMNESNVTSDQIAHFILGRMDGSNRWTANYAVYWTSATVNTRTVGDRTFLNLIELYSPTVSVPVANGYATYANHDYALDFSNVDGLTAYTATVNGNEVTFAKAGQVPAGTGVLLKKSTEDTSFDVPVVATAEEVSNVLFAPTTAVSGLAFETTEEGVTYNNYILTQPSGKAVGFYRANNSNVAVGKAYLRVNTSTLARQFSFIGLDGENETTGISNVEATSMAADSFYNLNGQRVAQPQRGLYVVNGKKVIIK